MSRSTEIAGLAGPTILIANASEEINLHIWDENLAPVTYLNGMLLFVAGLAIARAHNVWRRDWTVAVTLLGWCPMAAGAWRMFAPESQQGGDNVPTCVVIALLACFASSLTYRAYSPLRRDRAAA
jgi:hypothetical protein